MKIFSAILLATLFLTCQPQPKQPASPQLFGAEKISTAAPEFATTLNEDQTEVYFNRTNPDRSSMQIMKSTFQNDQWSEAIALPFSTGVHRDVDPFLTSDGQRLYFSSDRPVDSTGNQGIFNTWYIEQHNGQWSEPINPGAPLNSDSTEIFISLSKAGHAYFVSERDGDRSVWRSRFERGQHQNPEKIQLRLGDKVIYAGNPCIASDDSFLIVAARDPEKGTPPDLYISWNKENQWSTLQNLGPVINSAYADFAPGLSKDDQLLFFTSERPGILPEQAEGIRPPGDIYWVELEGVIKDLK